MRRCMERITREEERSCTIIKTQWFGYLDCRDRDGILDLDFWINFLGIYLDCSFGRRISGHGMVSANHYLGRATAGIRQHEVGIIVWTCDRGWGWIFFLLFLVDLLFSS